MLGHPEHRALSTSHIKSRPVLHFPPGPRVQAETWGQVCEASTRCAPCRVQVTAASVGRPCPPAGCKTCLCGCALALAARGCQGCSCLWFMPHPLPTEARCLAFCRSWRGFPVPPLRTSCPLQASTSPTNPGCPLVLKGLQDPPCLFVSLWVLGAPTESVLYAPC